MAWIVVDFSEIERRACVLRSMSRLRLDDAGPSIWGRFVTEDLPLFAFAGYFKTLGLTSYPHVSRNGTRLRPFGAAKSCAFRANIGT